MPYTDRSDLMKIHDTVRLSVVGLAFADYDRVKAHYD
jgi:hypothetical protein